MQMFDLLPIVAAVLLIIIAVNIATKSEPAKGNIWLLPALLSATFLAFSLYAVATEGSMGFWVEHTRSAWGNQIWFDLLLAIGIGWALIVPQAKAQGMRLLPWLVLILATGSIGFLAMFSRLLYLQHHSSEKN